MLKSILLGLCSALLIALSFARVTHAADVVMISHPGTTISAREVKEAFLGGKQFAGTIKLIPVDNAALQGDFLSQFIQMDAAKYNGVWIKKSFRDGLIPPAVKSGDKEVIEFVRRRPGAIGYVSSAPDGVKIIP